MAEGRTSRKRGQMHHSPSSPSPSPPTKRRKSTSSPSSSINSNCGIPKRVTRAATATAAAAVAAAAAAAADPASRLAVSSGMDTSEPTKAVGAATKPAPPEQEPQPVSQSPPSAEPQSAASPEASIKEEPQVLPNAEPSTGVDRLLFPVRWVVWDDPSALAPMEFRDHRNPFALQKMNMRWADTALFGGTNDTFHYIARWEGFQRNIKNVLRDLGRPKNFKEMDSVTQQKLEEFCPRVADFINQRQDCGGENFLRGYVNYTLWKYIFSREGQKHWRHPEWRAFALMRDSLQELNTDYDSSWNDSFHCWKRHTARLLYTKYGFPTSFERAERVVTEHLLPLYDTTASRSSEELAKLFSVLGDCAVEFEHIMVSSEEVIEIVMGDPKTGKLHGFPLIDGPDESATELMNIEWIAQEEQPLVNFVVQPLFRVWGERWEALGLPENEDTKDEVSSNSKVAEGVSSGEKPQEVHKSKSLALMSFNCMGELGMWEAPVRDRLVCKCRKEGLVSAGRRIGGQ